MTTLGEGIVTRLGSDNLCTPDGRTYDALWREPDGLHVPLIGRNQARARLTTSTLYTASGLFTRFTAVLAACCAAGAPFTTATAVGDAASHNAAVSRPATPGAAAPLSVGGRRGPMPLNGPGVDCGQLVTPNGGSGGLRATNGLTCPEAKAAFDRYLSDPARAMGGRWQLVSYDDGWTCLTTLYPGVTGPRVGGVWKECELDLVTHSIGQTPGNPRAELDWLGSNA